MILRNMNQKRILFAENGVDRWNAGPVASAILRRIAASSEVRINHFDVTVVNRMHEVLHTGRHFNNPFCSIAADQSEVTVSTSDLGF